MRSVSFPPLKGLSEFREKRNTRFYNNITFFSVVRLFRTIRAVIAKEIQLCKTTPVIGK